MSDEILVNQLDIGNRFIHREELSRFRGLPQEVVCIDDDKNRLAIMYGDRVNHYEETILLSDLAEGTLEACLKLLKFKYLNKTITTGSDTLDTNQYSIFDLAISSDTQLTLQANDIGTNEAREVTIVVFNANGSNLLFTNSIRWVGKEPEFPKTAGSKFLIKLFYTSTGWIGELRASLDSSESSEDSSLINISEEDKQIMSDISQHLTEIRNIASALSDLTALKTNLNDLITVGNNTAQLVNLAESIDSLTDLSTSLDKILEVQQYLNMINIVAHHIKDKYFLDVKVTDRKIDGNTILPLDKIVLAPAEYTSSGGGSGTGFIDTDSSDGTITPSLLIWSDEDIPDNAVGDGTIIVTRTSNKINPVTKE